MARRWTIAPVAFALTAVLAATTASAQPPVARPQPPPPAPVTKAPPKPGTTAAPAPASPQKPGTAPQTAPPAPPPAAAAKALPAAPPVETPPPACPQTAPVLAGAQYIESYDAGMGQFFCLFGSTQTFADVVTYYRTVLKDRGELVFDAPATHAFEVGKFKETEVAFPPGVTVKDYTSGGSPGYMNPRPGVTPSFFPTVIQIVSPPPALASRRD